MDTFVAIGTMFYTGEKAPVSGVYHFVYHVDGTFCLNHLERVMHIRGW